MSDERAPNKQLPTLSIKAKLLIVLAALTLVSVVMIASLSIVTLFQIGQDAKQAGSKTLKAQAGQYLLYLVSGNGPAT